MKSEEEIYAELVRRYGSWRSLAGDLDNAPVTDVGRAVLEEAIETHTSFFTDDWLKRAIDKRAGATTSIWDWPLGTPRAVIQVLERSARIRLLDAASQGALSASSRATLGPRSFGHTDIVLETAGLAARAGWQVEVIEEQPGRKTPDLLLRRLGMQYLIEVTSLGFDRHMINAERFSTTFRMQTIVFEDDHEVDVTTDLALPYLDDAQTAEWFEALASAADAVTPGQPVEVTLPEGCATLHARGERSASATLFSSRELTGDMWTRFGRRLRDKAAQTAGCPSWIRIDESSGMFVFSTAAHLEPAARHQLLLGMCEAELVDFPHVRGVIVSHGAELGGDDQSASIGLDRHREPWMGSALVDQPLPGRRRRLTYVISLERGSRPALPSSAELQAARWYADEGSWLQWAHNQLGLPPVESLLQPEERSGTLDGWRW